MKKNAFTLVELLAVIVILSVVSLIAVPQLFNAIKSNNVDSYNGIVKNIILAAESYANNHNGILVQMPVAKLQEEGYLPSNLKNPVNNNTMNGCVYAIDGDTYYKEETCSVYITHLNPSMIVAPTTCEYTNGYVWNFEYTGDVQDFTVPCNGTYKVELWGAQGGSAKYSTQYDGGKGGYTKGNISLTQNQKIYLYVGGMGVSHSGTSSDTVTNNGNGYNGGGTGIFFSGNSNGGGGGGATDVRYFDGTPTDSDLAWNSNLGLNSRIMVSAGGGGGDSHYQSPSYSGPGGAGGGIIGYNGNGSTVCYSYGAYGTQITGGYSVACDSSHGTTSSGPYIGSFGVGGTSYHTGGGSGYYGGGSGQHTSAGGGSSYISGHAGCLAIDGTSTSNPRTLKSGCTASSTSVDCSTHYSGLKFTDTVMIDGAGYNWTTTKGSQVGMPKHDGTEGTMTGNSGDGYARITLVSSVSDNHENTVTFETWDGTLSSYTKNVAFNTAIGELPIPTIENATLEGWYLDSDYTTKIDETYVVTEDITLYAMYKYDLSLLSNVGWSTYHSGNAMERKEYDSASDRFVFYVGGSATGATYYTHRFTTELIPISSPCKINVTHSMMSGNNYSPSGTVQIKDRAGNILYQTTTLGSATSDIEVPAGGFSIYANYYGPGNWFVSVNVNSILLK